MYMLFIGFKEQENVHVFTEFQGLCYKYTDEG